MEHSMVCWLMSIACFICGVCSKEKQDWHYWYIITSIWLAASIIIGALK